MDGLNKELTTNEAVILKRTFEQIGNNIINDLDKRINDYIVIAYYLSTIVAFIISFLSHVYWK